MKQRRETWARLSNETKNFVITYLKQNLKLDETQYETFLFPDYEQTLLNPKSMLGIDKAVNRIIDAISKDEQICVYGDYDCDGVPGTALVRDFFDKIKYPNVEFYIPHRHNEGYGLNTKAIESFVSNRKEKDKVKLLLTIDLGTTNITEIDYANTLHIDTIVTDHHLPIEHNDGQVLPKAFAIINNKQTNCNYANKDLCGTGTIFKLICAVINEVKTNQEYNNHNSHPSIQNIKQLANGYEKWLLDLVAIATVADMVPLTYENRTLTIYGLYVLSKTNRAGLQTLFVNAKTDIKKVNETDIGFTVAPRINSASRMATPKIALSMFSADLKEGINAAHELEELNKSRKETTNSIIKKIYKNLDARILNTVNKKLPEIVVIGSGDWNAGILGILASKVLDKYNVNVFCWGGEADKDQLNYQKNILFRGSARSRGDIHLVKLMTTVSNIFEHFGGHELAGGFSITFDNVHTLEILLNTHIETSRIENMVQQKKDNSKSNVINLHINDLTSDFLVGLNLIGPFGIGNPKPIFKIDGILETKVEKFGKSKEHLKMKFKGNNSKIEAIKFFVENEETENILSLHNNGQLFYEVEAGWMTNNPRLKIII